MTQVINPSSDSSDKGSNRRGFIKAGTSLAAAAGLTSALARSVHSAEDNKIRVALIGCGGRGTGAAENALQVDNGEIELVAMADVFENRLSSSYSKLKENFPTKVDVPKERQFVSFDGYKQAMDARRPNTFCTTRQKNTQLQASSWEPSPNSSRSERRSLSKPGLQ